jgi:Starch synthase catalytic domain
MRICLISVEFFINKSGGFGRAARTIGRELAARGVEVYALVPRHGDQGPREEHDGVIVLGFSKRRPWEAYWLCKEIDADVYHSCEPSMTTVFARWAMSPKKHIITFRPAELGRLVERVRATGTQQAAGDLELDIRGQPPRPTDRAASTASAAT